MANGGRRRDGLARIAVKKRKKAARVKLAAFLRVANLFMNTWGIFDEIFNMKVFYLEIFNERNKKIY